MNNGRVDFIQRHACLKSFAPLNPLGKGQQIFTKPHLIDEIGIWGSGTSCDFSKVTAVVRGLISGLLPPSTVQVQLSLSLSRGTSV